MIQDVSFSASSKASFSQGTEVSFSQPLYLASHTDTLVTCNGTNIISTVWGKIKEGVHTFVRFLKRIFCCCCAESSQEQSLETLKTVRKELKRRLQKVKEGVGSRQVLQGWWRQQFDSLHISVRELLLLEDVKLYSPPDTKNEDEWAKANIDNYRSRAFDFVANLFTQTENGSVHDPLDDLENFVDKVILILEGV